METDGDQKQQSSANGSAPSGTNSRPSQMNSMSLYERQAVQALQALQRQPNAAQYFQQLMLQQQINTAQLQNLAAVQQVRQQATLAASRQSSPSSQSQSAGTTVSQSQSTSTAVTSVNVTTSGGGTTTNSRTIGQGSSATSTISQSVLLSGSAGGQGQMYLRVNRSLRAPIPSQLIFMPGSTATAAVATVTQQPQAHQQQQQQQEGTPTSTSSSLSDSDQVQNLVLRGSSGTKGVGVKTEAPERGDSASYSLIQPVHQQLPGNPPPSPSNKPSSHPQPTQLTHIKIPTYPQSSKPGNPSPGSSIPLSQLLLHGPSFASGRAITTVTAAAANATHILVPTSSSQSRGGYPVGAATVKPPGAAAQTLVVQPLQKASSVVVVGDKAGGAHGNGGPVPIQPKTLQGLRLPPLQLPSRNPPPILPAPPSSVATAPPPHIPVQIVGARQSALGNSQALGLAQARTSCSQDGGPGGGLLTTVASSREGGGAAGRGAGLKSLQSWQEALPLAHVSQRQPPTANQSPARICTSASSSALLAQSSSSSVSSSSSLSHSSLPLPPSGGEESRGAAAVVVTTNGDTGGGPTSQGKQPIGSLKRKSESDVTAEDDGPPPPHLQPMRERPAPPLSSSAVEAGPGHPSPPPPSPAPPPSLSASRLGGGPGERAAPPQAVVKPHVLTHLIEGFVIQEGAEPFPVCGPVKEPAGEDFTNDNPDASQSESVTPATVLKCEYCKRFAPASQFRGTKRFCSMTCAKRYNVSFRMRQGHHHSNQGHHQGNQPSCLSQSDEDGVMRRRLPRRTSSEIASAKIAGRPLPVKCRSESSHSDEASSGEEEDEEDDALSLSPASSTSCHQPPPALPLDGSAPHFLPGSPAQWSVEEVSQFISSLHGCEELAAHFLSQEIDGQALLLLREEHLMSTMNIKLGPALKICAHINTLRD